MRERGNVQIISAICQVGLFILGLIYIGHEPVLFGKILIEISIAIGFAGGVLYQRFSGRNLLALMILLLTLECMILVFRSEVFILILDAIFASGLILNFFISRKRLPYG